MISYWGVEHGEVSKAFGMPKFMGGAKAVKVAKPVGPKPPDILGHSSGPTYFGQKVNGMSGTDHSTMKAGVKAFKKAGKPSPITYPSQTTKPKPPKLF